MTMSRQPRLSFLMLVFLPAVLLGMSAQAFLAGQPQQLAVTPQTTRHDRTTPSTTALFAEAKSSRQPWNVFRFVQQSSKFVSILPQRTTSKTLKPGSVVWEPTTRTDFNFAPLDDVVMGGASSSSVTSTGKWTGQVTDANNGGFVGIRSTPYFEYDMSQCQGIEVTVKTTSKNKRRYKLGLRDSKEFNGIVWTASFDVNGGNNGAATTKKVRIPFSKLVPTLFAGVVPNPPPFQKRNVVGIQFVYSKFEYNGRLNDSFQVGNVDLELVSIKAY